MREKARARFYFFAHVICFFFRFYRERESTREEQKEEEEEEEEEFLVDDARLCVCISLLCCVYLITARLKCISTRAFLCVL